MVDFVTLNSNLVEAENIISSSYHFRLPDLSIDDICSADIMISILQARVITEGMCRFIVLKEHLVKDEKSIRTATLKVYVEDLLRPNLLVPKAIISNMSIIQGISNLTVHFQTEGHLNQKEAYICLESLEQVLTWFISTYSTTVLKKNSWKISSDMLNKSGTLPPKAEGCLISRSKEVEEVRKIILSDRIVYISGYSGVGKTELAKDYVMKYCKKYDGVYYAENIVEVEDYIYNLPIGIINEELKTKGEIVEEKLEVLHAMGLTYLFIIDNYTGNNKEIQSLYPIDDDKYHLMILLGDGYESNQDHKYYKVNSFSPEESMQIFQYFCEKKYAKDDVMNLLSYLCFNPRAIKMSAIFLKDNDLFSPNTLIDGMRKNTSIKSIIQNLYIVLTEISILESDESVRMVSECLSLIPYNGVSMDRFKSLLLGVKNIPFRENDIELAIDKLLGAGWMNIDDMGYISINPLLSDTIYEKMHPDMSSPLIVGFIEPLLEPIKDIRELYLSQVVALEPFVDHLMNRVSVSKSCDLDILNKLREYYMAIYDVQKVEFITEIMEAEFNQHINKEVNIIENAIYRHGISRFNLEDFQDAHKNFERSLEMLEQKIVLIEKDIARICAYEGSTLAAIGEKEKAIICAKRSIGLREKLYAAGDEEEGSRLWISHYNFAKVLLELSKFVEAKQECDIAINLYAKSNPEVFRDKKSTNVSSLLQIKGRIYAGLGRRNEAIELLEEAKDIRERLKGKNYFSTAQIYSYLMDVHSQFGNYGQAMKYAQQYYDVLVIQYKTDDIKNKIADVKEKMSLFKENMGNDLL